MFDPYPKEGDVVAELRRWGSLNVGDPIPTQGWGDPLKALLNTAADEIERLRGVAGCCTDGPILADLKKPAPGMD